jgi:DNA-binding CsgD family transcriptional regulator
MDSAQFAVGGQRYGYLVVGDEQLQLDELTPAERDVVQLVVSGFTNRQIAERRRASVHTVSNQLAAVYVKLGVSSRHELVAWLARAARSSV